MLKGNKVGYCDQKSCDGKGKKGMCFLRRRVPGLAPQLFARLW